MTADPRRVITTRRPSHTVSNSARIIGAGRGKFGCTTTTLSSATLVMSRKPLPRSDAMTGTGVLASPFHFTVGAEHSFTKAAAKLGVSQSTLSHTIRELEARLWRSLTASRSKLCEPAQPRYFAT